MEIDRPEKLIVNLVKKNWKVKDEFDSVTNFLVWVIHSNQFLDVGDAFNNYHPLPRAE